MKGIAIDMNDIEGVEHDVGLLHMTENVHVEMLNSQRELIGRYGVSTDDQELIWIGHVFWCIRALQDTGILAGRSEDCVTKSVRLPELPEEFVELVCRGAFERCEDYGFSEEEMMGVLAHAAGYLIKVLWEHGTLVPSELPGPWMWDSPLKQARDRGTEAA